MKRTADPTAGIRPPPLPVGPAAAARARTRRRARPAALLPCYSATGTSALATIIFCTGPPEVTWPDSETERT